MAMAITQASVYAAPNHTYRAQLPALGEAGESELSLTQERKLGALIMRQVRQDPDYLNDPDTAEYLNHLGLQLVSVSPSRHMDFEFFAVRDASINAFALPGGYIGVHSGLVLIAQSEAELASVLAHEIGHVSQRHVARMLAKERESKAISLGTLLLALLAARSGSSSSADLAQAALFGGQAAAIQQALNFTNDAEREADRVGLQMLTDANFDPNAASLFFGRMQKGARLYESAATEYRRTHPLTVERIGDLQARARELIAAPRTWRPDGLEFHLVRARLRVLQENTQQGIRDAMAYFKARIQEKSTTSMAGAHYGLAVAALQLDQPQQAMQAIEAAQKKARMPHPMLDKVAAQARYLAAERMPPSEARSTEIQAAIDIAQQNSARFPLSRLAALTYVELLQRSDAHTQAIAFMRTQLALPKDSVAYHELFARSYAALNQMSLSHQATAEVYALLGAFSAAIQQLQLARQASDADFYVMSAIDARMRQLMQQLREQREDAQRAGTPVPPLPPSER